jgi:hypothetical protein
MSDSSRPIRFDLQVPPDGRIEVQLPSFVGSQVTVYVVEGSGDEFHDLAAAASSSLDFWDNPEDDEDWNNA